MGKGSVRRPTQIDSDEFEDNWERIFKRNDKNLEKNRYRRGKDGTGTHERNK